MVSHFTLLLLLKVFTIVAGDAVTLVPQADFVSDTGFTGRMALDSDSTGSVWLAPIEDSNAQPKQRVYKYNADGEQVLHYQMTFIGGDAHPNAAAAAQGWPRSSDVQVGEDDNVYVLGNTGLGYYMQKISSSGDLLLEWDAPNTRVMDFIDGQLWASGYNTLTEVYTTDGTLVETFTRNQDGANHNDVCTYVKASTGYYYSLCRWSNTVYVLDSGKNFVKSWPVDTDQSAMGLDIDANDNLYVQIVRAAGTYHVLVYDVDGNKNGDEIDIPGTQATVGYIVEIVTTGELLVGPSPAIMSFSGPAPFTVADPWVPGPIPFPDDPVQRAICRQRQSETECVNGDETCSWNQMLSVCNERGYQPLVQTCAACAIGS